MLFRHIMNVLYTILFVAFMYVLGLIPSITIPLVNIPINIQLLGIFVTCSLIGRYGFLSILIFLAFVAFGFPFLTGNMGGIEIFIGPFGGYLYGYAVAALVIGWLTKRYWTYYSFIHSLSFNTLGLILIYVIGTSFYISETGTEINIAIINNLKAIFGGFLLVCVASIVASMFRKYVPLIEERSVIDKTSINL